MAETKLPAKPLAATSASGMAGFLSRPSPRVANEQAYQHYLVYTWFVFAELKMCMHRQV